MRTYLFLLLLGGLGLVSNAQNRRNQEPFSTKTLTGESIKNVEVETSGGNISVTGAAASEARLEMYVHRSNNRSGDRELTKEEIQQRLDADYTLDISVSSGTLTAKAKPKKRNMDWKQALSISFKVYAPQAVSTELTTSGGNIELTNLSGEERFTTSGGNLVIDGLTGKTKGTTSGGNVTVRNSKNDIKLSTSGGNIEAIDCTGDLHLSTSGGSLRLSNLNGVVDASTSGGNVRGSNIEGELTTHTSGGDINLTDLACSLETSTSGGNIDVAVKRPGKFIRISNSGGNIALALPRNISADLDLQADRVSTGKLDAFSGTIEEDEVRGKLNGGGISIKADAGSGKLSLSFQ